MCEALGLTLSNPIYAPMKSHSPQQWEVQYSKGSALSTLAELPLLGETGGLCVALRKWTVKNRKKRKREKKWFGKGEKKGWEGVQRARGDRDTRP